jgi:hypothetical protein
VLNSISTGIARILRSIWRALSDISFMFHLPRGKIFPRASSLITRRP